MHSAPDQAFPLRELIEDLRQRGLDITQAFGAAQYNTAIVGHPTLTPLHLFGRSDALALLVANSRALWAPFLAAMRADAALSAHTDPLDAYVERSVLEATSALKILARVYLAPQNQPSFVSMLHAAPASGLAQRSPVQLALHPELGFWFGLRAVVVFDAAAPAPSPAPSPPCDVCPRPCVGPFERALEDYRATGEASVASSWRAWLSVRDACPWVASTAIRTSKSAITTPRTCRACARWWPHWAMGKAFRHPAPAPTNLPSRHVRTAASNR